MNIISEKKLSLEIYPNHILFKLCTNVDKKMPISMIVNRMFNIMRENNGMGLACPQVSLPIRMFVCSLEIGNKKEDLVFINPVIKKYSKSKNFALEKCLSLPNIEGMVQRSDLIIIEAKNSNWENFTIEAHGINARCLQHEYDHLNGILIINRFSSKWKRENKKAINQLKNNI